MSDNQLRAVEGTIHFDGPMATKGFRFNKMCYSFNSEDNRQAFRDDPEAYMERFGISDEQRQAVRDQDIIRMLELGGSIYYMAKFAIIFGWNMQIIGGMQTGRTTEEFKAYLESQGRGKHHG
ncbi:MULTISPECIES: protocatechuate 3,4-dioxygenase [unclassified Oceanobacter]|jgi:protocatechuate 4,5-dioxygenase alpha chain|uniref:protocatechuate 3,4-dioxygenase n=1 Tax=unclassified Oceanobacter TaxID=2620260 RepID=UPI0026E1C1A0|nr:MULTISPECIES: protocatechuate 3,4-dioxygenase [unclassified Oceanobacter]MDO6681904.1 protocatechuate 3,4-dioxygenase [Oceanobacter sp. 5_MG-2023]MDP2505266.1 protocatechuate 3,4-dioxygenase [Oceanobacter sp. 3_MG-2023]MDP2549282.1 protocatechuate 3,4-dioxygenase [Oceanobacter sp. 4_MG-2023]MDP2607909.1 protocatechuate 3,4-dioxygenase [Oceanobacter sp. 1_MG-2023]MDP2611429.1 protocatechuate 3,4-dioxygenase [Oceanobacter sp. 2_MG-2023]